MLTTDGVDPFVTWHSNVTCTSCASPVRSNGGVNRGHGFTTKPFVTLEGDVTIGHRCPGVQIAPKVMEILERSLSSDQRRKYSLLTERNS